MVRTALFAVVALCLHCGQPATAQNTNTYDDWAAYFGPVDALPERACVATTRAGRVSLYLAAAPSPTARPQVFTVLEDTRWNIPHEPVTFQMELSDGAWNMHGYGQGTAVVVRWSDMTNFLTFMEDVASNELMTLRSQNGTELATFSLEGSRSATIELETCVKSRGQALLEIIDLDDVDNIENVRNPF